MGNALRSLQELLLDRQHARILRLTFPHHDGPKPELLVNKLEADEGLSRDFEFTVELLSNDAALDLKDLQGKLLSVELVRHDGGIRYFTGYVFSFRFIRTDGGAAFYEASLGPWLKYHTVCEQNPVGRGFADGWHIRARKLERVPAPQIEAPSRPVGRLGAAYAPEGFGVVGRAWKPRLGLAGTYDRTWLDERHPNLPADFNFAYWNGAPADQQVTPHLDGDETVTLCNLCPAGAGTMRDATGNTLLSFALPGHLPFVLVRFQDGRIGELAARLDTVIIDAAPDAGNPDKKPSVVCVWRATVATEPGVRVLEARMLTRTDVAALRSKPPRTAIV